MSSGSAKRRKRKRRQAERPRAQRPQQERGYAKARAKDEEARAKLKPLPKGERPTAVTVGAVVAALFALANVVALVVSYDPDEPGKTIGTAGASVILVVVAVGMWRARYWAVLGMQTMLALLLISSAVALVGAASALRAIALLLIFACAGALFWFLIKAMARIQMPERPGAKR
jgi:hypothetical protein